MSSLGHLSMAEFIHRQRGIDYSFSHSHKNREGKREIINKYLGKRKKIDFVALRGN